MACLLKTGTAMDDDFGCQSLAVTVGHGDLLCRADRHMDASARLIDEPVKFGRGVVAEHGFRSSAQDSGPQQRDPGWLPGEGGVDAAVDRSPAATVHLRVDDPDTLARLGNLPAGDDAVLGFEQFLA